ncbi:helix-turn-helix domain-containing protein [Alkalibacillus silvisoli]|uniref:Helix-turn-helix domain-containing protein n=1 Tax=Alkalibacillus silvisoli TaxID=392823 RepID=A0ABN0ZWY7_9BACI
MELGQRLKEERESRSFSIEEISEQTKIQKRYLIAIEEHDWSKIPGNFYVRAFIREYAEAVGLNGEELIDEYANDLPSGDDRSYEYMTPSRKNSKASRTGNKIFAFLPKLLVFLLVIGIGFAIWYSVVNFIQPAMSGNGEEDTQEIISAPEQEEEEDDEATDEDEDNGASEEEENENEEEVEEINPSLVVQDVNEDGTPRTVYELIDADSFELTLDTTDETYLEVTTIENGGEPNQPFTGMFSTSDAPLEIELEGESFEVELNIGLASNFDIEVNGIELEYELDPDENVHQRVIIEWENEMEED